LSRKHSSPAHTAARPLKWSGFGLLVQGKEVALKVGETLIGRGTECDIVILSPLVSRKHARLIASAGGVRVQDLGSANGTYVNGNRIQDAKLRDGDGILVGTLEISFFVGLADPGATLGKQVQVGATQPLPSGRVSGVRDVPTSVKVLGTTIEQDDPKISPSHGLAPLITTGTFAVDREEITGQALRPPDPRAPDAGQSFSPRAAEPTLPGSSQVVAEVVDRMLARGDVDAASRAALSQFRTVTQDALSGVAPSRQTISTAAACCMKLALATAEGAWFDRAIEVHLQAQQPMSEALIDQLTAVRKTVRVHDQVLFERYQDLVACDRILALKLE
jgi:pSer/pThr/pTyr-binding forkhead associated (FHA) protein